MKALYLRLQTFWTRYLLGPDWSPFVVLSDWLKSECSYCHFWRGVFFGAGCAFIACDHFWIGLIIAILPFILVGAEDSYGKN